MPQSFIKIKIIWTMDVDGWKMDWINGLWMDGIIMDKMDGMLDLLWMG